MLTNRVRTLLTSRSGLAAGLQTALANIAILGINAATGVITARILNPTGRGELAAIILWPQFLAFVLTLGLPSALLYSLKRYPARAPQLFSSALLLGTGMSLLAALVGVLSIPHWLNEYSPEVVRFAQWIMLFTPLIMLSTVFAAALQAREEFALFNAVRYLPPLLTLLALGLLALVQGLTPFSAALSYTLPVVPIFLWMLVRLWRSYRPVWQGRGSAFKRLISYGLRSYGIDLSGTLARQLDQALVVGLLSPAMMGLYVVALSSARVLEAFQTAVVLVLFPKASGRPVEEVVAMTGRATRVGTTVTLLAAAGLALLGPWLLSLLYGQEFLGAVTVFRILLFEVVLGSTAWVLAQAFMAVGRPGVVTLMQGIGLGLAVLLLVVLVPRYGLEGAGMALLASAAARLALVILSFPLILKVPVPRPLPTRSDFAAILDSTRKVQRNEDSDD